MPVGVLIALALAAQPAPKPVLGEDDPAYWTGLLDQGVADYKAGRYAEAERSMRKLYDNALPLGLDNNLTQLAALNLGVILSAEGRYPEARAVLYPLLVAQEKARGQFDARTLETGATLGDIIRLQGDLAVAETLNRLVYDRRLRTLGAEAEDTLVSLNNLAATEADLGHAAEAERLYRQAAAGFAHRLGPDDARTLSAQANLAGAIMDTGRIADAEPLLRQVLGARRRVLGETHPDTLASANNLAGALRELGRRDEALALQREAWTRMRASLGEDHPAVLTLANNYAGLLDPRRDAAEREAILRHVLTVREKSLGPAHPDTLSAVNNLGLALAAAGRGDAAEPLVARAATGLAAQVRPGETPPPQVVVAYGNLGKLELDLKRPPAAYSAYRTAAEGVRARYADRRVSGGEDQAQTLLAGGRDIFIGQIRAGWAWATSAKGS